MKKFDWDEVLHLMAQENLSLHDFILGVRFFLLNRTFEIYWRENIRIGFECAYSIKNETLFACNHHETWSRITDQLYTLQNKHIELQDMWNGMYAFLCNQPYDQNAREIWRDGWKFANDQFLYGRNSN